MMQIITYKKPVTLNGRQHFMKELLSVNEVQEARVRRIFTDAITNEQMFEWRATAGFCHAKVPVMGLSKRIDKQPSNWYPVQDCEPVNTHMTEGELLEAALMAVRAELRLRGRTPENTAPVEALLVLLQMIHKEPDLIFADWVHTAIADFSLINFVAEWEKEMNPDHVVFGVNLIAHTHPIVRISPGSLERIVD